MEKIAEAIWKNRISPVFDVSESIRIFETEDRVILGRMDIVFSAKDPYGKARMLADTGVDTLICGAISMPFSEALGACGLRVIPFVTGEAEAVLTAYMNGCLNSAVFAMPGCQGRRARRRRGRGKKTDF